MPKAYLNAFCDDRGRLLVYRKDNPAKPLHVAPDATQFRRYYYSQPTPEGGRDSKLEGFFSTVESEWPKTVALLHQRENVNDRLERIFEFMSLQRVRVPAMRDALEAAMARNIKDRMKVLLAKGLLPPPPLQLNDSDNQVEVAIDPHQSLHAMAAILKGLGKLLDMVGLAAVHNATTHPFITSDNPVVWFDPSLPFDEQQPYNVNSNGGPVMLFFPVSPKLVLFGDSSYKDMFGHHGLLHSDVRDAKFVHLLNAQVCRFAYEAVITQSPGHESMIMRYADISPVHTAQSIPMDDGLAIIHRQVFGQRKVKPKWGD